MYRVEVDWAPAFELIASLKAYLAKSEHRTLDLGAEWIKSVKASLELELAEALSSVKVLSYFHLFDLLAWQCPGDRSAAGYLEWLERLSLGELYERLAPELEKPRKDLPEDLRATRDHYLRILAAWHEQYFQSVDEAILTGLQADADAKQALTGKMSAEELVELATNGVHYVPEPVPEVVLLVPQYHFRPWNIFANYRRMRLIEYPAEILQAVPGDPPARVVRMARLLSDESRLRILRFLSNGPQSFTDVVRFSGLSKSTVHHHMVALRAAGLVRVHESGDKMTAYTLRVGAVDDLGDALRAYLLPKEARARGNEQRGDDDGG